MAEVKQFMINNVNYTVKDETARNAIEDLVYVGTTPASSYTDILVAPTSSTISLATIEDLGYVTPEMFGAKGDGITNDTQALSSALNQGLPCLLEGTYLINSAITTDSPYIYGRGEIKGNAGIAYLVSTTSNIVVEGIKFNSNNTARGGLSVMSCNSAVIKNCEFTGYSASSGHASNDSLLLFGDVVTSIVDGCNFHDSGYSYGTTVDTLNRCITNDNYNTGAGTCKVSNCRFNHINQGIVSVGVLLVENCEFDEVADNCLYLFDNAEVNNCRFVGDDEGAVVKGGDYSFNNCYFSTSNTSISINGDTDSVKISNCVFESEAHTFITSRESTYTVNLIAINCDFRSTGTIDTTIGCMGANSKYLFSNCLISYATCTNIISSSNAPRIKLENCIVTATSATRVCNQNSNLVIDNCDVSALTMNNLSTGIFSASPKFSSSYWTPAVVVKTTRILFVAFGIKNGAATTGSAYEGLPRLDSAQTVTTPAGNVFTYRKDGTIKLDTYTTDENISVVISW